MNLWPRAKLSERGFGNLFWIATARRRGDLNDFFGDDVRDRIVAINKIERASAKVYALFSLST
jgi:hypothetical protein